MYVRNEIIPLREELAVVNEHLPAHLQVRFGDGPATAGTLDATEEKGIVSEG